MLILFEFAEKGEVDAVEIEDELKSYSSILRDTELKMILGNSEDLQNAIVSIHPGAGGTESQDWAQMLYRMYTRWAEKESCSLEVIDFQQGDEAGLKDVTFEIKGNYLGYLKFRRALASSTKVINFDKEEIDVIKDAQGQVIAKGTISIVGLPDEYK